MTPAIGVPIIAMFVQSVLYGLYSATFVHCIRWLVFDDDGWKFRETMNWFMILMTTLIFILSTANFGISVPLTFEIITKPDITVRFIRFDVINGVFEYTTYLITDGILIYRCWIIYGKSWRAISLPLLLIIANVLCIILNISRLAIASQSQHNLNMFTAHSIWQVAAAIIALSIAINVYATSAIVWRVLRIANGSGSRPTRTRLHKICRALVESGGLLTVTSILNLIPTLLGEGYVAVVTDEMNFSMAGIAFNLILIRVYAQRVNARRDIQAGSQRSQQANTENMSALRPRFRTPDGSLLTHMSSIAEAAQNAHPVTDIVEEVHER